MFTKEKEHFKSLSNKATRTLGGVAILLQLNVTEINKKMEGRDEVGYVTDMLEKHQKMIESIEGYREYLKGLEL